MYFVDVGQGDCTLIVTPQRTNELVDGGTGTAALQFLIWKHRLDLDDSPNLRLYRVVITHADRDHLEGIVAIVGHPRIVVDEIWHSGVALYERGPKQTGVGDFTEIGEHEYLADWRAELDDLDNEPLDGAYTELLDAIGAARAKGDEARYRRVVFGDSFNLDGVTFDVLGPRPELVGGQRRLRRFDTGNGHAKTINGHSVILRVTHGRYELSCRATSTKRPASTSWKTPTWSTNSKPLW